MLNVYILEKFTVLYGKFKSLYFICDLKLHENCVDWL